MAFLLAVYSLIRFLSALSLSLTVALKNIVRRQTRLWLDPAMCRNLGRIRVFLLPFLVCSAASEAGALVFVPGMRVCIFRLRNGRRGKASLHAFAQFLGVHCYSETLNCPSDSDRKRSSSWAHVRARPCSSVCPNCFVCAKIFLAARSGSGLEWKCFFMFRSTSRQKRRKDCTIAPESLSYHSMFSFIQPLCKYKRLTHKKCFETLSTEMRMSNYTTFEYRFGRHLFIYFLERVLSLVWSWNRIE